jgi:raffinose/stachyose/melibiose transport system substrate-binding protein
MKKRLMIMLCVLVLLASACGKADPQEQQSTDTGKASSATSNETSSDKAIEITMLTAMAYGTEGLDIAVENFKKLHPNVSFDIQHMPNDYETILKSRINAGEFPDIIAAQTGSMVSSYYDFAYDFTNDPVLDKFNTGAIELSKSSDGKVLSLPWTYETMGIIYNKDVFEKAGITELPATMDELEAVCQELEAQGILPFATALKEPWVLAHIASHYMTTENEDPMKTIDALSKGDITFSEMDNFNNLYRLLDMMVEYGPSKFLEIDWEKSENMLANGETAMIHMGDWCEAVLKDFNPDVNVGFLPVPVSNNADESYLLSSISWQLLANKDSENVEMTKEFLEYILTSEDGQVWMTEYVGAVPATKTNMQVTGMLASSAKESIDEGMTRPWNHTLWPSGYNMKMGAFLQEYLFNVADAEGSNEKITAGWIDEVQ